MGVFNKAIIPLVLVGYEMVIDKSALRASLASYLQLAHNCDKENRLCSRQAGGGALGYFGGGYVPPGTPNWHPVLKTNSPNIDTPF